MADEYGDDDFEDYDDEFEDDAEEEAPTAADAQKVIAEADSEMRARLAEAGDARIGGAALTAGAATVTAKKALAGQTPAFFIAPPTKEALSLIHI